MPNTFKEQMVMHEVQSNPLKGATNLKVKRGMKLGNPKWHDDDG